MLQIIIKLPPPKCVHLRQLARIKNMHYHQISSKAIRETFLDYFIKENGHEFIRSSPVVPFCDPSIAFVNAGMNQFKGIFLGSQKAEAKRVANSQKCIRVGGKHNDLTAVGADGYHHTFFEMLGNWSFGDYFKEEACRMAWDLLTNVYKLPPNRLYVTYFKGSEELRLKADVETKEMWQKIGVPIDRILPFGVEDNFWEMGIIGPCGTCTELHFDHLGAANRSQFVNRGLHDLTEVWNIVFVQFNRNKDGSITELPKYHIDTGMGLERLTAILQGKISNYDTDIFTYLLNAIKKICPNVPPYGGKFGENDWNNLDMSYRILSDHIRMVTVALADGMIPEQNQKLRRVLRRCFQLSESVFQNQNNLVGELVNYVVDNLGGVYPEMEQRIKEIHQIIDYELDVYNSNKAAASKKWQELLKQHKKLQSIDIIESPNLVQAVNDILEQSAKEVDAFKLYDTYGLDEDVIEKLASVLNFKFDSDLLKQQLEIARLKSRQQIVDVGINKDVLKQLIKEHAEKTDDSFKYHYRRNVSDKFVYEFPELKVTVLNIIGNNEFKTELKEDAFCSVLLDKTNLYSEKGGQSSDCGQILFDNGNILDIVGTNNLNGYILHNGFFKKKKDSLSIGSKGILKVDSDIRFRNMQNHTGIHLLNAALKKIKGATCQKSSKVTPDYFTLDVAIFGSKLDLNDVKLVEETIMNVIRNAIPVTLMHLNSQQLLKLDKVTLIPGEIYPEDDIRLIEVVCNKNDFISREPCCGTHLANTIDLEDFSIISWKSLGRSTISLTAVTGKRAVLAKTNAMDILEEITKLKSSLDDNIDKIEMLEMAVTVMKQRLNYEINGEDILPLVVKHECLNCLDGITKHIKSTARASLKDFIEMEMQNVLESNVKTTPNTKKPYIVHYLRSSTMMESVSLTQATKLCPHLPILVIAYANGVVKARCCVPKEMVNNDFNAEKWLKSTVGSTFKANTAPPKGQNGALVCNMKAKKVNFQDWDALLHESLHIAQTFVDNYLK